MPDAYPFFQIRGASAYERGLSYGSQARKYIETAADYYRVRLLEQPGRNTLQKCLRLFEKEVADFDPEQLEELKGISDGSGVPFDDLLMVNARYELTKFPKEPECTTGAVLKEASGSGVFAFKNWDLSWRIMDHVIILDILFEDGTRIVGPSEAGQMIRDGVNSCGIALTANNLQSLQDHAGPGIPTVFLRRKILRAKTLAEAEDILLNAKRTVSNNIMLVSSRENAAKDYEWQPDTADILYPENGILTHANHFTVRPERDALTDRPKNRDTRMKELLSEKHGNIGVDDIRTILCDHTYYPLSICGHPDPQGNSYVRERSTVCSWIADFDRQQIHICRGRPCEGTYLTYSFAG